MLMHEELAEEEILEDKEQNVYDRDIVEDKMDNDEIDPEEEAFMLGYLGEVVQE